MEKFYQMPVILELVSHMVSTTDKYSLSRYSAFSSAQLLVSSKQFDCSQHQPHIVSHIASSGFKFKSQPGVSDVAQKSCQLQLARHVAHEGFHLRR